MNSLNRPLAKIGTTMLTRRLLSRTSNVLPNPNTSNNNSGTSSKHLTARAIAYYTGGTALVGSGVVLAYAMYNPQFREYLKTKSEMADKVIQFLWRENKNEDENKGED